MTSTLIDHDTDMTASVRRVSGEAARIGRAADAAAPAALHAVRADDDSAWPALIKRLEPLVYSIAWKSGVRAADIDDVVQSVWLILWRRLDDLRDPNAVYGWVATITRHAAVESLRSGRRTVVVDFTDGNHPWAEADADDVSSTQRPVDHELERQERVRAVRAGLGELSTRHRDLLLMLAADPPIPYREISDRLGIPVGSIGPTRARLLRRLASSTAVRRLLSGPGPCRDAGGRAGVPPARQDAPIARHDSNRRSPHVSQRAVDDPANEGRVPARVY